MSSTTLRLRGRIAPTGRLATARASQAVRAGIRRPQGLVGLLRRRPAPSADGLGAGVARSGTPGMHEAAVSRLLPTRATGAALAAHGTPSGGSIPPQGLGTRLP